MIETALFNAMMSRETKLTISGVDFSWKLITGTTKEREKAALKKSKELAALLDD